MRDNIVPNCHQPYPLFVQGRSKLRRESPRAPRRWPRRSWAAGVALAVAVAAGFRAGAVEPPAPVLPVPSPAQLAWQEDELTMFTHFGMNTFTGRSTGLGTEDPKLFNPTDLDCGQWARVAKECGFKGIILTAKHHDGFCLWPTATTDHSVRLSTWRDGKGDVVAELATACRKEGIKLGIYCSPWDRSQTNYDTDRPAYAKLYRRQLTELLSNYGPVYEMWFDGNKANVATWPEVIKTVRTLQPDAVIKQGSRIVPVTEDVRWVGNEQARGPLTSWSVYPPPGTNDDAPRIWFPIECDTMMVGHWFWDNSAPKDLATLLNFYYTSVGRNSILLLNVAPDKRGQFSDESVKRLREFRAALDSIFGTDLAAHKPATASNVRGNDPAFGADKAVDGDKETYWATDDGVTSASLEVDLGPAAEFNVVRSEEVIRLGQRVQEYTVDAWDDTQGAWKTIVQGTTIGHCKLDRFPRVKASKVRLTIVKARGCPTIRTFGVFLDTVSPPSSFEPANALAEGGSRR
jgi:alpha-L-fucosidase